MTVVAIDGPAGAGKSTVARETARALGYRFVDTGAMYRAVALGVLRAGIDPSNAAALEELARKMAPTIDHDGNRLLLAGEDVDAALRTPPVTAAVVPVSANAEVRAALVARQRQLAAGYDVVMEGRDIGAEVVPDAAVKVFLTASPRERARRRALQQGLGEGGSVLDVMEAEIAARDAADAARLASPFRKAPGAVEVDTTGLAVEEVVARIVALARKASARD